MSERSDRPGQGGGEPMAGQPNPAAPTAAELPIGRHERAGGSAERTSLFAPAEFSQDGGHGELTERPAGRGADELVAGSVDRGAVPPWQRIGSQSGGADTTTTEVRRPGGVATAPAEQTTVQARTESPSGPSGGSPGGPPPGGPPGPSGAPHGPGPGPAGPRQPGPLGPGGPPGGPPNGQLANPFGGSAPDPSASAATAHIETNVGRPQQQLPLNRPTARPNVQSRARAGRAPRRASLQIRRFDPWSVLKLSLVLSVAMFLMWLVAVGVLYGVLNGMGVWDKLNGAWDDLASVNESGGGGAELISAGRVFGVSAVIGAVNIVLFTAFATVTAFIYNVSADLAGGIEVTLSERD